MTKEFKSIEPPDSMHLKAAEGWLELGDNASAREELENISQELQAHPGVLEVRWEIYAKEKRWEDCVELARSLTQLVPANPAGWIHCAYSLRRADGGGLPAAWDLLSTVADKFPDVPVIPYNLACYAAQMNRLDYARACLKKAFAIATKQGTHNQIRRMAMEDPDLEPLWKEIAST